MKTTSRALDNSPKAFGEGHSHMFVPLRCYPPTPGPVPPKQRTDKVFNQAVEEQEEQPNSWAYYLQLV